MAPIKYIYIFILFFLLIFQQKYLLANLNDFNNYEVGANVNISYKAGNKRHIRQGNLMLYLHQSSSNLIYTNIRGISDTASSLEGNLGLGYRQLYSSYFIGTYLFLDRRKSKFNITFNQITFGGEIVTDQFEFRTNFYLPENHKLILGQSRIQKNEFDGTSTILSTVINDRIITPLSGFDIEAGMHLDKLFSSSAYLTYYHFSANNLPTMHGIRIRAALPLTNWFSFEGEFNYDPLRRINAYIGATLAISTENNLDKLNKLLRKPPVRDIDILIAEAQVPNIVYKNELPGEQAIFTTQSFSKNALEALKSIPSNPSGIVVRTDDSIYHKYINPLRPIDIYNIYKLCSQVNSDKSEKILSLLYEDLLYIS